MGIMIFAGRTGFLMIDLGLALVCCIGSAALVAIVIMWRILTTDHPDDGR